MYLGECALSRGMTGGFLIPLYKICYIILYVFSAVHIMLLPSQRSSSSSSFLKCAYVTGQLHHSLVMHSLPDSLLKKLLYPPLRWRKGKNKEKSTQCKQAHLGFEVTRLRRPLQTDTIRAKPWTCIFTTQHKEVNITVPVTFELSMQKEAGLFGWLKIVRHTFVPTQRKRWC